MLNNANGVFRALFSCCTSPHVAVDTEVNLVAQVEQERNSEILPDVTSAIQMSGERLQEPLHVLSGQTDVNPNSKRGLNSSNVEIYAESDREEWPHFPKKGDGLNRQLSRHLAETRSVSGDIYLSSSNKNRSLIQGSINLRRTYSEAGPDRVETRSRIRANFIGTVKEIAGPTSTKQASKNSKDIQQRSDDAASKSSDSKELSKKEKEELYKRVSGLKPDQCREYQKTLDKPDDAFSKTVGKWFVETAYSGWSANNATRMLMYVRENLSLPADADYTIGSLSVDVNGGGGLGSLLCSIVDTRAVYRGVQKARVDLINSKLSMLNQLIARGVADFIKKLRVYIKEYDVKFSNEKVKKEVLDALWVAYKYAIKKAGEERKNAGSITDKTTTYHGKLIGGARDICVQPVQQSNGGIIFSIKEGVSKATDQTKELFKPVINGLAKFAAAVSMVSGSLQLIQGAYDTSVGNKKLERISTAKQRFQTAVGNMRARRTEEENFVDVLGEHIYLHSEAERKVVRCSTMWPRTAGIVRTVYGVLLIAMAILTLAVPMLAPIAGLLTMLLTSAFIGWTAIRVAYIRHRDKRLEKKKLAIEQNFEIIMRRIKPDVDAKAKAAEDAGEPTRSSNILNEFWRNPKYLRNRLFALKAAKHYLTSKEEYDPVSEKDCNGLTRSDRERLRLFLIEMGVPAESFSKTVGLGSDLKFHLIEEGAFMPADESPVHQAIRVLGKRDIERKRIGMEFLTSRIDSLVQNEERSREVYERAIKKAFVASTPDSRKKAMSKLVKLFVVVKPIAKLEPKKPATVPPEVDEILGCPPELGQYINSTFTGWEKDAHAARALFKKLRGYPVNRVMHSLKSFSGSWGSRLLMGDQRSRFDQVSTEVAKIALEERLSIGKNDVLKKDLAKRQKLVDFCAYAAKQDGMVGRWAFNHDVHPVFGRLVEVVTSAISGNKDANWLVDAIDAWPGLNDLSVTNRLELQSNFWEWMKVALFRKESDNTGARMVEALKNHVGGNFNSLNVSGEKEIPIPHVLDKLGKSFKEGGAQKAIEEIAKYLATISPKETEQDAVIDAIVKARYPDESDRELAFAMKVALKKRLPMYCDLLGKATNRIDSIENSKLWGVVPWFVTDKMKANAIATRKFIMDDLAVLCGEPACSGNHAMSPDVESSLREWARKSPDEVSRFLREHYSISADFTARNDAPFLNQPEEVKYKGKSEVKSKSKVESNERIFSSLLQMAGKFSEWAGKPPSFDVLYKSARSNDAAIRSAAFLYLRQNGLLSQEVKDAITNGELEDFSISLYAFSSRDDGYWSEVRSRLKKLEMELISPLQQMSIS